MAHRPPSYPVPYRQSGGVVYVERETNGLAVAALILGLCGFAVVPVVLGHVALHQIRDRHQSGAGLAVAGLVLGYLQLTLYLIVLLIVVGGAWALFSSG